MSVRHSACVAVLLAGVGCTTVYSEGQVDETAQRDLTIQNLQGQVNRLQESVNDMQAQREDLYRRMEQLEADVAAATREQQERAAALERNVAALDQARQKDREDVVAKVADLVKTTSAAQVSAEGYEHVVRTGETLSAIAAAYKVTPNAIIKANSLKNPNSLRVGQKLFIPE